MDDEILTIYCLCDNFLLSASQHDHPSCQMSSAEVMTVALVAVRPETAYVDDKIRHAC